MSLSCKRVSRRTILLSVISLLNEPNTFSPANVDASVMYRKWRDSKGKDREYIEIIRYKERRLQTLLFMPYKCSGYTEYWHRFSVFSFRRVSSLHALQETGAGYQS